MAVAGNIVIELKLDDKGMILGVSQAGGALRQFQSVANETAQSVKRLEAHHNALGARFRHMVTTLGALRFALMDVNDVFLKLPVAILKSAGELERMQFLMRGLSKELTEVGKQAEGAKSFKYVVDMAKTAPFSISALADSFVKLKSAGIDPTDGSMKALVDSVARFGGTSDTMKRASVAIQQMTGKGVVSMEELRQQLGEAVPTAMQNMADGMGISMARLAAIVKTGTLQAGPALGRMFVMMQIESEGAALAMMKTWEGTLARLKTDFSLAAQDIADAGFMDAAKGAVGKLGQVVQSEGFKTLSVEAGQSLGHVVDSLVKVVESAVKFKNEIGNAIQAFVAYKLVFSGAVPLAAALNASWENLTKTKGGYIAAVKAAAVGDRAAAFESAAASKAMSLAEEARIKGVLDGHRIELASARVKTNAILSSDAELLAKQKALRAADAVAPAKAEVFYAQQKNAQLLAAEVALRAELKALRATDLADMARFAVAKDAIERKLILNSQLQAQAAAQLTAAEANLTRQAEVLAVAEAGVAKQLAANSVLMKEQAAAALAASAAVTTQTQALATQAVVTAEATLATQANTAKTGLMAAAAWGAAAAQKALGGAMMLLGGPVGLAIIAIGSLIYFYRSVANAAEESADRQIRAAQGIADAASLDDAISYKKRKTLALSVAKDRAERFTGEEKVKAQAELLNVQGELVAAEKVVLDSQIAIQTSKAREKLKVYDYAMEQEINKIRGNAKLKVSEIEAAERVALDAAVKSGKVKPGSTEFDDLKFGFSKQKAAVQVAGMKEQAAALLREEQKAVDAARLLRATAGRAIDADAQTQLAIKRGNDREQLEAEIKANEDRMNVAPTYKPEKGSKGGKKHKEPSTGPSPEQIKDAHVLVGLTEKIRAERAALVEEIAGLESETNVANRIAIKLAKFEQQLKDNKFDRRIGKGKHERVVKPSIEEQYDYANETVQLEMDKKRAEALKSATTHLRQIQPQYEDALAAFMNPERDAKKGSSENSLDKLIANMKALGHSGFEIASAFNKAGSSLGEMRAKAVAIDSADRFKKVVAETKTMNESLVADGRLSAQKRAEAEDARHASELQNIIDKIKATGDVATAEKMQVAASENNAARMAATQQKFMSPMQKMAVEWNNTTRNMEDATAKWGQSVVDTITDSTKTGGDKWRFLADMILRDFAKISLQKALSGTITDTVGAAGGFGAKLLGGPTDKTAAGKDGATNSLFSGVSDVFKSLTTAGKGLWDSFTGTKTAVSDLATNGIAKMAVSAATSATEEVTKTATMITATTSLTAFTLAVQAATAAAAASAVSSGAETGGGVFGAIAGIMTAANGGILGEFGSVPLRKYARGGIARSPQLALYGEAGPEAYVPLPDGRSIPVTMSGAAGQQGVGNVTIQINVDASGGDNKDDKQQGDMNSMWGQVAQKVRGVVVAEISTQQRPGGLLYR